MTDAATPPSDSPSSASDIFCPHCGYNLRGIESSNCPECGEAFDRATIQSSQIPWVHRRATGIWRAYWRTVWMTTFNISALSREMSRPVSLRDAQSFRRNVSLTVAIPLAAAIIFVSWTNVSFDLSFAFQAMAMGMMKNAGLAIPYLAGVLMWPVMAIVSGIFIWLATGTASYFFHPHEMSVIHQNRAVALSHYACGSLGWMPLVIIATGVLLVLEHYEVVKNRERIFYPIGVAVGFAGWIVVILWWLNTVRLLAITTETTFLAAISKGCAIIVLWGLTAVILLAGVPWVIGFLYLFLNTVWG